VVTATSASPSPPCLDRSVLVHLPNHCRRNEPHRRREAVFQSVSKFRGCFSRLYTRDGAVRKPTGNPQSTLFSSSRRWKMEMHDAFDRSARRNEANPAPVRIGRTTHYGRGSCWNRYLAHRGDQSQFACDRSQNRRSLVPRRQGNH
jgi:hypothetical protein